MTAAGGHAVTTACPTRCDPDCELGTAGCHERHAYRPGHDPDGCEARRAAADGHSRLSAELAGGEPDGGWVCPHCRRGRCHRCTSRDCHCCAGSPDDTA